MNIYCDDKIAQFKGFFVKVIIKGLWLLVCSRLMLKIARLLCLELVSVR